MTILSLEQFVPHVGASFALPDRPPATLTLQAAEPLAGGKIPGAIGSEDRRSSFVLTFRSADPVNWGQDTYRIGHPTLGPLDVFMVPIAGDGQGITYEAVFN